MPLYTQTVNLIKSKIHGVFSSNNGYNYPTVMRNRLEIIQFDWIHAAREDASAKSTKESTHGPGISLELSNKSNKGRSLVRSCEKDLIKVSGWQAILLFQRTMNVGSFKITSPLKPKLWGGEVLFKKIHFCINFWFIVNLF